MQVMIEITNPLAREQTMTKTEDRSKIVAIKELLERDEDFVRSAVQSFVQAALEAEMTEALAAEKGERTEGRLGYRSGYYSRALITRVGTLELRVPQDRAGRFSTELFERYQRSEKALVGTLAEMYVQGVSTRKVKTVTEALCGHSFSASSISAINKSLDESLKAFSERRLRTLSLTSFSMRVTSASGRAGSSRTRPCSWLSRLTGKAGGRFSRSSLPIARAGRAGATFFWA